MSVVGRAIQSADPIVLGIVAALVIAFTTLALGGAGLFVLGAAAALAIAYAGVLPLVRAARRSVIPRHGPRKLSSRR